MELNKNEMKLYLIFFLQLSDHQQLHLKYSIDNLYQINNHAILEMHHLDITILINISNFRRQKKEILPLLDIKVLIDHKDKYFLQMIQLEMLLEDNNSPNQLLYYPNVYDHLLHQDHL
jgi:hypothetical protein